MQTLTGPLHVTQNLVAVLDLHQTDQTLLWVIIRARSIIVVWEYANVGATVPLLQVPHL